jgi:dihydrodipicolinate synthase/N-acetylneuraminate lyase
MVTPLKNGDRLDEAALDRLIEHVGAGADGLLFGDVFWGEGLVLGRDTRLALYTTVLEIVQGRWPVFLTITADQGKEVLHLISHTEDFSERFDYPGRVYWFDYPIYYHSNRGLPQWYASMPQYRGNGLLLANHSGLVQKCKRNVKHKNIRTSVLKKISELEEIRGLVFSGSLKRSMNYHRAVRDRRDFRFYDGDELSFIRRPSSDGVVAGGANLFPKAWRDIVRSCLNPFDAGQEYRGHTSRMLQTAAMVQDFSGLYRDNKAGIMKRMLHVAGILPHAGTGSATVPPTAEQNRSVDCLLGKYGVA